MAIDHDQTSLTTILFVRLGGQEPCWSQLITDHQLVTGCWEQLMQLLLLLFTSLPVLSREWGHHNDHESSSHFPHSLLSTSGTFRESRNS